MLEKRIALHLVLIVCCHFFSCTKVSGELETPSFFERINLDYPGLEKVRLAVQQEDYSAAVKAYVLFQRSRSIPRYPIDKGLPQKYPSQQRLPEKGREEHALSNTFTHFDATYRFEEPIDWHFNPTDQQQNPDWPGPLMKEWTLMFNRHSILVYLANAFHRTGNPVYSAKIDKLLNSWLDGAPLVVPERGDDLYRSSWRTLEAGIRVQETWPVTWMRTINAPELQDETIFRWVKSWMQHGDYLASKHGTLNWLTTESVGLYTVGTFFPEFKKAADWRRLAEHRLREQMETNFYPDGAHVELTPHYHRISIEAYAALLLLARMNNYQLDERFGNCIRNGYDYLVKLSMPNRAIPRLNDGPSEQLTEKLKEYCLRLFPENEHYRWFIHNGVQGKAPEFTSVQLPWAGQAVLRNDWSEHANYLLFEYGPYGEGTHQHEDKLGIHLVLQGKLLVFEAGSGDYGKSAMRDFSLGSSAHSVITIDGLSQARAAAKSVLGPTTEPYPVRWTTTESFDFVSATYGARTGEAYGTKREVQNLGIWRRSVLFLKPDIFVITDVINPEDNRAHTYQSHFHLDAEKATVEESTQQIIIEGENRSTFRISPLAGDIRTQVEILKGQTNPDLQGWEVLPGGKKREISTVRFTKKGAGVQHFAYLFQATPGGAGVSPVSLEQVETKAGIFAFRVQTTTGSGDQDFTIVLATDEQASSMDWKNQNYPTTALLIDAGGKVYALY